jgi:hypothetical protein
MKITVLFLALLICIPVCRSEDAIASFGKQTTVIPANKHGLQFFPDAPISIISTSPPTFLMAVGVTNSKGVVGTYLMKGKTFETAKPVGISVRPSGRTDTYDETCTGVGGIYLDKQNKQILAFMNCENATEYPSPTTPYRFYATCGLAISKDGGNTFQKVGPFLTGRLEDSNWKGAAQGNAMPSVCVDHTGQWLYAYYTEHSRENPATGQTRSVITCMARSKVKDGGKPGTWFKYYEGSFGEPGLGGKDTEVADCWAAHVTYIPEIKKYIMMGLRDGICYFSSDDGVNWSEKRELMGEHCLRIPENKNEPVYNTPSLIIESAKETEAKGTLFYGFTPNSRVSMHLAKCPVSFTVNSPIQTVAR